MINSFGQFPKKRMRDLRRDNFSRRLVQENILHVNDFIYPVFVLDGMHREEKVTSMPGVVRQSVDLLMKQAERCLTLGIPAIAIFPVIDTNLKSLTADEAYNPDGLVPRVVRQLKQNFPELGVITDIALDPYTSHGQDGLIDELGYVLNDETVEVLCQQALVHAQAGADIVAPSDMMDGRVGYIREALDQNGFTDVGILSYAAKYCSGFYGPFRDALESAPRGGEKKTYQMDPANMREALRGVRLDIAEGADIVMVKPAVPYLDVIRMVKESVDVAIAAYHVSGEYAMIKAAAQKGWLNEQDIVQETLLSIKRAGADIIFTYCAKMYASVRAR
ncbi:MAG: porphobilinogen synthase [Candidatus Omnitrophica bacterium]|nr:porphobilinogen synthase [Candidatus Omnitrophota bacterium]